MTSSGAGLVALLLVCVFVGAMIVNCTSLHICARSSGGTDERISAETVSFWTLWWFDTEGGIKYSSPTVVDIDNNGDLEIIVGAMGPPPENLERGALLYAINHDNTLLWKSRLDYGVYSSATVADIDGDNYLEVLVGGDRVYAFNHDGTLLWKANWPGGLIASTPQVVDLYNDGTPEVVVGQDGGICAFDNNGILLWIFEVGNVYNSSPAIVDINDDNKLEVIIGAEYPPWTDNYSLFVLNRHGALLQKFDFDNNEVSSTPTVVDIDEDGYLEILIQCWDGYLYAINHDNTLLWKAKIAENYGHAGLGQNVADIDNDGHLEVLVGSWDGYLYAINHDGALLWKFGAGINYVIPALVGVIPAVADMDNDGDSEIIGGTGCEIFATNHDGTEWGRYIVVAQEDIAYSSPTVVDINGDGKLDVLIGSRDGGWLYALTTNSWGFAIQDNAVVVTSEWPLMRSPHVEVILPTELSFELEMTQTSPNEWHGALSLPKLGTYDISVSITDAGGCTPAALFGKLKYGEQPLSTTPRGPSLDLFFSLTLIALVVGMLAIYLKGKHKP